MLNRYVTMASYSFCFSTCAPHKARITLLSTTGGICFSEKRAGDAGGKRGCPPRQGAVKSPPDTSCTSLAGPV